MPSRLEQYLDDVTKPVALAYREEWREEVRQHLTAMTAAYEEIGHDPEVAAELALNEFGDAHAIGRQVQARIARPANTVEAMKGFIYPCALFFVVLSLYALKGLPIYAETGDEATISGPMALARAMLFLAPIFGGWVMARRLHGRLTMRRILSGLMLGIPLCILEIALFTTVGSAFREPSLFHGNGLPGICVWMLVWFFLATGTAYITRRVRGRHRAFATR